MWLYKIKGIRCRVSINTLERHAINISMCSTLVLTSPTINNPCYHSITILVNSQLKVSSANFCRCKCWLIHTSQSILCQILTNWQSTVNWDVDWVSTEYRSSVEWDVNGLLIKGKSMVEKRYQLTLNCLTHDPKLVRKNTIKLQLHPFHTCAGECYRG